MSYALASGSPRYAALLEERDSIKRACFQKIHPRAFAQWTERERRIKEYLSTTSNPTVAGMQNHVFREFTPFLQVLARYSKGPADSLAFEREAVITNPVR